MFLSGNVNAENRLPPDFTVRGRNLNIFVKTDEFNVDLSKVFLTLGTTAEGDLSIAVKTDSSAKLYSPPREIPADNLELKTDMSINGRIDSAFKWADLDVSMKKLQTDFFAINRIKFNFRYESSGVLVVTKTGDNIPADLVLTADFNNGLYNADLAAQNFVFSRYFYTGKVLDNYKPVTDAVISGEASASINSKTNDIKYSGNLSVGNITGVTEEPFAVEAVFSGINNKLDIENSRISLNFGEASFSGGILISELPEINGKLNIPFIDYKGMKLSSTLFVQTDKSGKYKIKLIEYTF